MKYKVIMNTSPDYFAQAVNKALAEGWELQGGVSIGAFPNAAGFPQAVFVQAIVKQDVRNE